MVPYYELRKRITKIDKTSLNEQTVITKEAAQNKQINNRKKENTEMNGYLYLRPTEAKLIILEFLQQIPDNVRVIMKGKWDA